MNAETQKAILAATGRFIRKMLEPVDDRIKALEGRIVEKGDPGKDGEPGRDGKDGIPGADGKSISADDVAPLVESAIARGLLETERRGMDMIQRAIEAIPKPEKGADGTNGKDGLDAFGFDDMTMEYDGRRGFSFKFMQGERVKTFDFVAPLVLDAGFYQEGKSYEAGDGVTFGGSYWIAKTETTQKPGVASEDWRLCAKKGRDGKVS
jgi:hypothetical protein